MRRRNSDAFDRAMAEIRRLFTEKPTTNRWWEVVDTLSTVYGDDFHLVMDYLRVFLAQSSAWRQGSVPCGCWDNSNVGWLLSQLTYRNFPSYPEQKMVWCPPGSFKMGPDDWDWAALPMEFYHHGLGDDVQRQGEVTIDRGFWIGTHPVTIGMWQNTIPRDLWEDARSEDIANGGPDWDYPGIELDVRIYQAREDIPVYGVNWYDAIAFCNFLSEDEDLDPVYSFAPLSSEVSRWGIPGLHDTRTGLPEYHGLYSFDRHSLQIDDNANGYRIPTEEQWEYAARAGSERSRYNHDPLRETRDDVAPIAWYHENCGRHFSRTIPRIVGQLDPNAWGLYDTLGNLWEWTIRAAHRFSDGQTQHDANQSLRGGSCDDEQERIRVTAMRYPLHGTYHSHPSHGFRICRLEGKTKPKTKAWRPMDWRVRKP